MIHFVYIDLAGPRNGAIPESVVVKFWELYAQVVPNITNYPNGVAIPATQAD